MKGGFLMDEHSDGSKRLIVFILVVAAIAGAWFVIQRSGTLEAVDETLDVFVPDQPEFERRLHAIDQAREVTDLINSRQSYTREPE